jgi:hypothetical protein
MKLVQQRLARALAQENTPEDDSRSSFEETEG